MDKEVEVVDVEIEVMGEKVEVMDEEIEHHTHNHFRFIYPHWFGHCH